MAYKINPNEAKLPRAVAYLKGKQDVPGQCLGYCRAALGTIGLRLPPPELLEAKYGHSTAMNCYRELAADPAAYGWVRVTQPLDHPIMLAFYDNCGITDSGLVCGHAALLSARDGKLYSSQDYPDNAYFIARLVGLFIPAA